MRMPLPRFVAHSKNGHTSQKAQAISNTRCAFSAILIRLGHSVNTYNGVGKQNNAPYSIYKCCEGNAI